MKMVNNTTHSVRFFGSTDRHAEARWGMKKSRDLGRVEDLMSDLYFGVKCGFGAAEYNLEEAGMIEMIFPHVAGEMRHGDNGWNDTRYTITKRGRRTNKAELKRIVLRDPPLEIAVSDAKLEAFDVADDCGGCDPDDRWLLLHKRILQHLIMRVERIVEKEKRNVHRQLRRG